MNRGKPTHGVKIDLGTPTIVMVTVCAKDRETWLASPDVHEALEETWRNADAWAVGRYVMLPDHLHLFCSPRDPAVALPSWIAYWKSLASRRWPRPGEKPLWQKNFWDTELRTHERYEWKWQYVFANPVRRGLVARAEEWPFAGEIECLEW